MTSSNSTRSSAGEYREHQPFSRGQRRRALSSRRYDGTGYPQEGPDELPLSAAILAVADTYDAIITDRPYRAG
jgi:hypothetical protein